MPARRILVIKHGALGDIIQGLDGYASLRAGHPDAHLAVLTTAPFAGLFAAMPFFDEVLVDHRASLLNLLQTLRIRGVLHNGWDRIYDFQCSRRTRRYFAHLAPRGVETVGIHPGASHPLPEMAHLNNRDRMITTAVTGGCPETETETGWLAGAGETVPRDRVILIPGCSPAKPEKRWPAGHYADLARMLISEGHRVALVGTAVDRAAGDVVMAGAEGCTDYIGKTTLPELAAMLAAARVVVGNDTGPVFMAARLGAPTLMLMSRHTDPGMSAPYGPAAAWMREDAIEKITPAMVLDHLRTMNPGL